MKVVHPNINLPLVSEDCLVNETVIENEMVFSNVVIDLYGQLEGQSGELVFSERSKIVSSKSVYLIAKPSDTEMNRRTILNKVYKHIEQETLKDAVPKEYFQALRELYEVISVFSKNYYLTPTLVEDVPFSQALSLFQMQFPVTDMTFMEQLMDFLSMHRELFKTRLFILIQVRAFMTRDDFEKLLEFARYEKIQIWLIESSEKCRPENQEGYYRLVVDQDGCEI